MAYLTDRQYEIRRENAAARQESQKEILTLSEEAHDAIAEICSLRHELHCLRESTIFNVESGRYTFPDEVCARINELIADQNLGNFKTIFWRDDLPTNSDWYEILTEEDKSAYLIDADKADPSSFDGYDKNGYLTDCYDLINSEKERVNKEIENILAAIDKKHGTSYCPTGSQRI